MIYLPVKVRQNRSSRFRDCRNRRAKIKKIFFDVAVLYTFIAFSKKLFIWKLQTNINFI